MNHVALADGFSLAVGSAVIKLGWIVESHAAQSVQLSQRNVFIFLSRHGLHFLAAGRAAMDWRN
jgi:hypothetical protein